jgi:ribosomal protein L35AE/L33A
LNLNDLRTHLRETLSGVSLVTSRDSDQLFGFATRSDQVSFLAAEYSIENGKDFTPTSNIAAALIFDNFCNRNLEELGDVDKESSYAEKHRLSIEAHRAIIKAGYVIKGCVNYTHAAGNMVRVEYYRHTGDGWTGSSLRVVYSPTNFSVPDAARLTNKHGEPCDMVYYTPAYEDGNLVYIGSSELDGQPNRTISINMIEGKTFRGTVLSRAHHALLGGLDVSHVFSVTQSESMEGCKLVYVAELNCGAMVEIVHKNYSWTN